MQGRQAWDQVHYAISQRQALQISYLSLQDEFESPVDRALRLVLLG